MNYKQNFNKILKYIQKSSSKGCVFEADFEYPKELRKLDNNCSLTPDKIEIKKCCLNVI